MKSAIKQTNPYMTIIQLPDGSYFINRFRLDKKGANAEGKKIAIKGQKYAAFPTDLFDAINMTADKNLNIASIIASIIPAKSWRVK